MKTQEPHIPGASTTSREGVLQRHNAVSGFARVVLRFLPFRFRRATLNTSLMMISILPLAFLQAQQLAPNEIVESFNTFAGSRLQEKIYVHTDRDLYLSGEILWLKLYVVDGMLHQPLNLSKVAYVELLDENNSPAVQAKLELEQGRGNGSVFIPITIRSGNYKLRAYTNWMKNDGAAYFFEKVITVINTQKDREKTAPASAENLPDIQFFPEGGNLVAGLKSVVACKITSPDGNGASFTGSILDEGNNTVTTLAAVKFGMAGFVLKPQSGHHYHAVIDINGTRYERPLPEIFAKGYVMTLDSHDLSSLTISVQSNVEKAGKVMLLVHTRQALKTILESALKDGVATFTVNRNELGDGISQLTVFNSNGSAVCERLCFTYPRQVLQIPVNDNQGQYPARSYVHLQMKPSIGNAVPVAADMSVSVYRLDELHGLSGTDIRTGLLLSSDLRGPVESPAFYFDNNAAVTAPVMDLLMLTQGWRRFKWNEVLQHSFPSLRFPPEASGHIVTGKVTSSITGRPIDNAEVYLSAPGFNTSVRSAVSDSAGRLKFDFKAMHGNTELIAVPGPGTDTTLRIDIATPFSGEFSNWRVPPLRLLSKNEELLRSLSIGAQAQNAYYGPKLKHFLQQPADTVSMSFDKPNATYFLDNYTRFTTMEEVLREYVAMISVQKRAKFTVNLFNDYPVPGSDLSGKMFFQPEPLILADGVPVFSTDRLMRFNPLKIRKLEVFNRQYHLGDSYAAGILSFTTYRGDYGGLELDPRALAIDYEGTLQEREFYSPVYTPGQAADHTPDFRTLLYWSHTIARDRKGDYSVSFYTSDVKGKYAAVVQGLSADGHPGTSTVFFEVK